MRPVELHTEDLRLRELEAGDLPALYSYDADPAVCRFQPWGPNDLDATRLYLARCLVAAAATPRQLYELALIRRADGVQVGNAGLRLVAGGDAELGFTLRREDWGKGYATQAARALVEFGLNLLGLPRVRALCDEENVASLRVLEKVGFVRVGAVREVRRGEWRTTLVFALEAGSAQGSAVGSTSSSAPAASRSSRLIAAVESGSPTAQTSSARSSRT